MKNQAQVSGILSIVSGVFGILGMIMLIVLVVMMRSLFEGEGFYTGYPEDEMLLWALNIYVVMAVISGLGGVFCIVGGFYAAKRRYWGFGLAAAIVSTIIFMPCGIPAIIFIALGKREFEAAEVLDDPLA